MLTPQATLALLYEAAGDHDRATQWMDAALKYAPKDFATQMAAAQWAAQTSQFDVARKYADAALALKPDALEAKLVLGVIDLLLKDYPAAEKRIRDGPGPVAFQFRRQQQPGLGPGGTKRPAKATARPWSMP